MAAAPILPLMSVEEYLNSAWRPDKEYVDGVLVERSVPTIAHSLLQMLLIRLFEPFEDRLSFVTLPEVRTQIVARSRYRIPDVMLCPTPLPEGKVVNTVPWAVIEILSPDDKTFDQLERFAEYASIGVGSISLLDPVRLVAHRYERDSLIRCSFSKLTLPGGEIPFDTDELFQRLVSKQRGSQSSSSS